MSSIDAEQETHSVSKNAPSEESNNAKQTTHISFQTEQGQEQIEDEITNEESTYLITNVHDNLPTINEASTFQGEEATRSSVKHISFENEEESDVNKIASNIFYDMIQSTLTKSNKVSDLYVQLDEHDELTAFIQNTLGALADDIEAGDREYTPHDEMYFWMTYFFLQFCGFRMLLAHLDEFIENGETVQEMTQLVIELVDNVAENAPYLHSDSDLPLDVARNIIWQILNSSRMKRRYNDKGIAYWQAGDFLDEVLDNVFSEPSKTSSGTFSSILLKESSESSSTIESTEPVECREFGGIFKVAELFVSNLIQEGTHALGQESRTKSYAAPSRSRVLTKAASKKTFDYKQVPYPTIQEFTVKVGKKTLIGLITQWKQYNLKEDWLYTIRYILGQSDSCSDFYLYEAKFGLPSPAYPVPQATCSLIFKIEVSRVKPPMCLVNITYKIEGSGYEYQPEEYAFQERWLLNLIEGKLRLFERTHF